MFPVVDKDRDDDSYIRPVGRLDVLYYGVGHMLNDITAACWFTYLLLFLTDIGLSPRDAATVMLSGQVADGLATVFTGELIDRFGRFKLWHVAGSVLVAISFSSVFGGCMPCKIFSTSSSVFETVAYSTFAAIFNIGWAATQVSHMSMVNCITLNSTSRVVMASCRNAFSMVANLSLYAIAYVVFDVYKAMTQADVEYQYRWIAYISIAIGCCFVAVFLFGTKEPRHPPDTVSIYKKYHGFGTSLKLKVGVHGRSEARICWSYWFKKVLYYQVAMVYMLTRLIVNVSQTYLAFYVIDELRMEDSAKALVPAIIYISSFVVSVILQEMAWTGQRLKVYYSVGGVLWIFCGVAILLLPCRLNSFMYLISIFIGIANALMLVTGVSMQSVLVGEDLNGCAFVYGSLSFLDKMSCGIAVYVLQSYQSTSPTVLGFTSSHLSLSVTRLGLGLVPAICSLAGVATTCTMKLQTHYSKHLVDPLLA